MFSILQWINGSGNNGESELNEVYHIGDSNCQDFARNIWHQLSEEPYPNPGKFENGTRGI